MDAVVFLAVVVFPLAAGIAYLLGRERAVNHTIVSGLMDERAVMVKQMAALAGRPVIHEQTLLPHEPEEEPDYEWVEP